MLVLPAILITVPGCFHPRPAPDLEKEKFKERLNAIVERHMNTPYKYGRQSERGIDCSGLVQIVFGELNHPLPRTVDELWDVGKKIRDKADLLPGDLLFFDLAFFSRVSHVGIYLGDGKFAHASKSRGVVVDSLDDEYFGKKYVAARRVI